MCTLTQGIQKKSKVNEKSKSTESQRSRSFRGLVFFETAHVQGERLSYYKVCCIVVVDAYYQISKVAQLGWPWWCTVVLFIMFSDFSYIS